MLMCECERLCTGCIEVDVRNPGAGALGSCELLSVNAGN